MHTTCLQRRISVDRRAPRTCGGPPGSEWRESTEMRRFCDAFIAADIKGSCTVTSLPREPECTFETEDAAMGLNKKPHARNKVNIGRGVGGVLRSIRTLREWEQSVCRSSQYRMPIAGESGTRTTQADAGHHLWNR